MRVTLLEGSSGDWLNLWLILILFLVLVKLGHMLCLRIFRHLKKQDEPPMENKLTDDTNGI